MWGEPIERDRDADDDRISTHSPRVGRTKILTPLIEIVGHFNSLAPCGANPFVSVLVSCSWRISTHSPRVGRTHQTPPCNSGLYNFNSLAPCGANRNAVFRLLPRSVISTHSPRVGRTFDVCELNAVLVISTHSPRVGRTIIGICHTHCIANFNSLAPCGANHNRSIISGTLSKFQLTRPVWGEPIFAKILYFPPRISTHSPRVGRTHTKRLAASPLGDFNSLAPCGANR